jgi:hypothetical protein
MFEKRQSLSRTAQSIKVCGNAILRAGTPNIGQYFTGKTKITGTPVRWYPRALASTFPFSQNVPPSAFNAAALHLCSSVLSLISFVVNLRSSLSEITTVVQHCRQA